MSTYPKRQQPTSRTAQSAVRENWRVKRTEAEPLVDTKNMIDYINDELRAVAKTTDDFGGKFLKAVATENPGNLITSSLSAQVVLAMAAYGARGTTAEQMRSILLIPMDDKFGLTGYESLIKYFNTPTGVELRLANKIYTSAKAAVKTDFKELTSTKFLSSSQEVDFKDTQGAADTINSWCKEQTNNRIKDLIKPGIITPLTALVLVSAVYFKGQWEKKFQKTFTRDKRFHINEFTTIDVPTMFIKSRLRLGKVAELRAKFIEIPYQGKELYMLIVLPDEITGLRMILDNIDNERTRKSLQQANNRDVELFLPKFKINSSLKLNTILKNLGMTEMFECTANFSGISEIGLSVSAVVQQAFIEVNEEGSEVAAATAAVLSNRGGFAEPPAVRFIVDRPFYYAIRDRLTEISLFTGVVHQPSVA